MICLWILVESKKRVAENGSTQVKYKYFKTVLKNSRD